MGFLGGASSKELTCQCRRPERLIPSLGRSLGEGESYHSNILAWRISWTEEPSGLRFIGSQRIGHDWSDWAQAQHTGWKIDIVAAVLLSWITLSGGNQLPRREDTGVALWGDPHARNWGHWGSHLGSFQSWLIFHMFGAWDDTLTSS